ncbi:hypothetical protein MXD81_58665 [Microbacteriaceae bacterium K1510]|nr:hypothetical protein [Microbacteriaceae bacterium K1510]
MSERMLVASRKGLISLAQKDGDWSITATDFPGVPVTAVLHDARDDTVYAVLKHGHFGSKLHRSDDGGKTWTELAAPAFPTGAEGSPALFQVWTLEAGGADEPGTLWAGALPAGLFRSTDRGERWELMRPLWNVPEREKWFGGGYDDAGIHSISPDPRDSRRVVVAISCGGVWDTDDSGATWRLQGEGLVATYMPPELAGVKESQDPHRVMRCAAAPDTMWMQHHCGIFRSADTGKTWTQLKPPGDDFGFAVAAHPQDANTAWFVPGMKDELRMPRAGALAVTRTRDGGKTWESLREGLPQKDAFDLIYRHGLDVDPTGRQLVMGSTTGGLWTSEDAGEHWTLINAHLPPVYAVRLY